MLADVTLKISMIPLGYLDATRLKNELDPEKTLDLWRSGGASRATPRKSTEMLSAISRVSSLQRHDLDDRKRPTSPVPACPLDAPSRRI